MDDGDDNMLYNLACDCESLFTAYPANHNAKTPSLTDLVVEYQQRFSIWASNLGLFARKSQSLDTRLQNHADIRDIVARSLDILRRSLHQRERFTCSFDSMRFGA